MKMRKTIAGIMAMTMAVSAIATTTAVTAFAADSTTSVTATAAATAVDYSGSSSVSYDLTAPYNSFTTTIAYKYNANKLAVNANADGLHFSIGGTAIPNLSDYIIDSYNRQATVSYDIESIELSVSSGGTTCKYSISSDTKSDDYSKDLEDYGKFLTYSELQSKLSAGFNCAFVDFDNSLAKMSSQYNNISLADGAVGLETAMRTADSITVNVKLASKTLSTISTNVQNSYTSAIKDTAATTNIVVSGTDLPTNYDVFQMGSKSFVRGTETNLIPFTVTNANNINTIDNVRQSSTETVDTKLASYKDLAMSDLGKAVTVMNATYATKPIAEFGAQSSTDYVKSLTTAIDLISDYVSVTGSAYLVPATDDAYASEDDLREAIDAEEKGITVSIDTSKVTTSQINRACTTLGYDNVTALVEAFVTADPDNAITWETGTYQNTGDADGSTDGYQNTTNTASADYYGTLHAKYLEEFIVKGYNSYAKSSVGGTTGMYDVYSQSTTPYTSFTDMSVNLKAVEAAQSTIEARATEISKLTKNSAEFTTWLAENPLAVGSAITTMSGDDWTVSVAKSLGVKSELFDVPVQTWVDLNSMYDWRTSSYYLAEITDTIGSNRGCKVTFHVDPNSLKRNEELVATVSSYDARKYFTSNSKVAIRVNGSSTNQFTNVITYDANASTITVDWDTITGTKFSDTVLYARTLSILSSLAFGMDTVTIEVPKQEQFIVVEEPDEEIKEDEVLEEEIGAGDPTDADIVDGFDEEEPEEDEDIFADESEDEDAMEDIEIPTNDKVEEEPAVTTPVTPVPQVTPVTPTVPTTNSTPSTGNAVPIGMGVMSILSAAAVAVKKLRK